MTAHTNASRDADWLLEDLVRRVAEIRHAVLLSADGLLIGSSSALTRADAEHLAAVASGFQSLARGAGRHFGAGQIRQTIIEMDTAFLFVTAAGHGACLAVFADAESDVGLVAFEMNMLVKRVGSNLATTVRSTPGRSGPGANPIFHR